MLVVNWAKRDNYICIVAKLKILSNRCLLKGATSQVAGSLAVLDRTAIVLDRIVIFLDRSVIAIYGIFSLNFLRLGCGSDHLWLLRAVRHTSAPALRTLSILSGDIIIRPWPALVCFLGPGVAPLRGDTAVDTKATVKGVRTGVKYVLVYSKIKFVCWLLNVPATGECISGTDLLRQLYVLPH